MGLAGTEKTNGRQHSAEVFDQPPPHDLEAEKTVLACLLLDRRCMPEVGAIVQPSGFLNPANASLYGYLLTAGSNGELGDTIVLRDGLRKAGLLKRCGGMAYLSELLNYLPVIPRLDHTKRAVDAAGIVQEKALLRAMIDANANALQEAYTGQKSAAEISADLQCELESTVGRGNGQTRFKAVDCRELATASYSVRFLIAETLCEGQPLFIGAAAKSCKTLIAIDAAVSLATATPLFGVEYLSVDQPVRVGYFSGEGGLAVVQEYATRVANGRGIQLADVPGLVFCDVLPQLEDAQDIAALEAFLIDNELRVIVLDPIYLCMPGDDAGNLMKQGKVLRRINQVCLRNACTPILIHHTKKNVVNPYAPPELSDLSWSGFAEFSGQWWLIGRREKYNADEPGEHALWLNVGGRAGHSALHALNIHEGSRKDPGGRYWSVDVVKASEAREGAREQQEASREAGQKKRLEADEKKLVNALAKFKAGETERTLRGASGVYDSRFKMALASLVNSGDVVRCDVYRACRKAPYEGWKLADADTP